MIYWYWKFFHITGHVWRDSIRQSLVAAHCKKLLMQSLGVFSPNKVLNNHSSWLWFETFLYSCDGPCNGLTHWGRVTYLCVSKQTIIGSDNGLSPGRHQAIIRTNDGILLIWTMETNFSEILCEIHTFSLKKMHLKMSSAKWWQFCLGLNVLTFVPKQPLKLWIL